MSIKTTNQDKSNSSPKAWKDLTRTIGEIKNTAKKKQFLPIYSDLPYSFQIDLTFFDSMKNLNNGYSVLFTAINVNTRFAYAYYGKNKEANTILDMLKQMEKKTIINSITCDEGSEFTNKIFVKYCEDHNITIYFCKNDKYKLGIVNRFHRTIKDKLREILNNESNHKYKWVDHIDKIVDEYNRTVNRGIGSAPIKVNNFMENEIVQSAKEKTDILKNNYKPMLTDFRINDYIKTIRRKNTFSDKMLSKYIDTVYKVIKVDNNSLIITDSKGLEQVIKKTEAILTPKPADFIIKNNLLDNEIKAKKIKKAVVASGVVAEDIRTGARIRKPNMKYFV